MSERIRNNYRHTIKASYIGFMTQAIVNNFTPLLYVTFNRSYGIPMSVVALLITVNFVVQFMVDLISAKFASKFSLRGLVIFAHAACAAGLICLGILPDLMSDHFLGIALSSVVCAVGGGLIEVLVSPLVEACPTTEKESEMSLLHSFYCWGSMGVILFSTLMFRLIGLENWRYVSFLLALVPAFNCIYFSAVSIWSLDEQRNTGKSRSLFKNRIFWILMLMMLAAGAAELTMSQWASSFAEKGLGVSKALGDIAGPCAFAALMGISRVIHSRLTSINLKKYLIYCGAGCIAGYLLACFSPHPALSLFGCAITGFSVGAMWPGTLSVAGKSLMEGGTGMFALLALAGDFGCTVGPTAAGLFSGSSGENLKSGIAAGIIFPVLLIVCCAVLYFITEKNNKETNRKQV